MRAEAREQLFFALCIRTDGRGLDREGFPSEKEKWKKNFKRKETERQREWGWSREELKEEKKPDQTPLDKMDQNESESSHIGQSWGQVERPRDKEVVKVTGLDTSSPLPTAIL